MISAPIVKSLLNGYQFLWYESAEWVLTVKVVRIIEQSHGALSGEFSIEHEFKDKPTISGIRVNLTSQQGRNTIVKRLTEANIVKDVDWADLIEQICSETIKLQRQGEPVRELWTSEDIARPEYLLEPILFKGLPTIIYGEKAAFKSGIGLIAYACLTLPWHDNPMGFIAANNSCKVLYLDWEADYNIAQWNLKRVVEGMELGAIPLYYRRGTLPLADDIEQIQNKMADIGAEVLIIDSLGPAVGGDLNKPEQALGFTMALRQLKCTSLIIAQTSKNRESQHKSIYGSTFFEYYARNIFELRNNSEQGEDEIDIALFNTYCNLAKKHKPMGFKVSFQDNDTKIVIEQEDAKTIPEFLERHGTTTRILDLLGNGKLTTKEIIDELKISRSNADTSLKRLRAAHKVLKDNDKWGLLYTEEMH